MPCLNVETGVSVLKPQVSVLGLILFLLYINGIKLGENDCKLAIFADDTTIIKLAIKAVTQFIKKSINYVNGFVRRT